MRDNVVIFFHIIYVSSKHGVKSGFLIDENGPYVKILYY